MSTFVFWFVVVCLTLASVESLLVLLIVVCVCSSRLCGDVWCVCEEEEEEELLEAWQGCEVCVGAVLSLLCVNFDQSTCALTARRLRWM